MPSESERSVSPYSAIIAISRAPKIPPIETSTNEAPASKGTTVPLPAPFPPILEPVGPIPAAGEAPVGYGVAKDMDVVATTLDCVSVDVIVADGEASAVVPAVESDAETGTAVAMQSQTALAAP